METLRFLMVSTYYPPLALGGDAYFVKYLSEELAKEGHEVHVFWSPSSYDLMRPGRANFRDLDGTPVMTHGHSYRHPRLEILSSLVFGHDSKSLRDFEEVCRDIKPDVVHWHNTRGFIREPVPVQRASNILTAHDYYMICPRANLLKPDMMPCSKARLCSVCSIRWRKPPQIWRFGEKRVLTPRKGVAIISPSRFLASKLMDEGIDVNSILSNFVPDVGMRESDKSTEAEATLVYLGMLEKHKGVMTLVRSFMNTRHLHGFRLVLVGDGSLRGNLEQLTRASASGNRILVKGFVPREELDNLLSTATMQIIPSEWYENAPLVAMEALSRGIPVLSSDMGGLPEILTADSGSMLFTGGNSRDLEDKLVMAWNRREEMPDNRLKARKEYEKRYLPSVHMKGYASILSHLSDG